MYLRVKYVFMTLESDLVLSNAINNNSKSDVFIIYYVYQKSLEQTFQTS